MPLILKCPNCGSQDLEKDAAFPKRISCNGCFSQWVVKILKPNADIPKADHVPEGMEGFTRLFGK